MNDNGTCPYCNKPFEPGQTLTSNEAEDVVHLDCENRIGYEIYLEMMTKEKLILKLKELLHNQFDCDYEILAKIRILLCDEKLDKYEMQVKESSCAENLFGDRL